MNVPVRPRKRVVRRRRLLKGAGFFSDVWSGIKKGASFVKNNGLISKGLTAGSMLTANPFLGTLAGATKLFGLGRKRKVGRPKRR